MSEEKYEKLIENVELNKIELQSLQCSQNKNFPAEKRGNIEVALKSNIIESKYEGVELDAQIQFEVFAFSQGSSEKRDLDNIADEDVLFNILFSLNLNYLLALEEIDDILQEFGEEINIFLDKNVPINAWPYARETISSITTRMGFPALLIQTHKNLPPF